MLCFPSTNIINEIMPPQPSILLELVKGLPAAFVALVIGAIATWIAYNQYKVARAKLNLDLFDKRHHIFQKTWECLSQIYGENSKKRLQDFTNLIPEASFIFGKDIGNYMKEISNKIIEFNILNTKIQNASNGHLGENDINRNAELATWLLNEASTGSRKMFSEYLDFSNWK